MKKTINILLLCIWTLFCSGISAQLSPGPLAEAHSHLEGLSNCLKCHVVGSKVSDQKCLDCHDALKKRIDANKGYHSAKSVKSKNCAECHSDHHGLSFEMIRFDEETFDHDLTGYVLRGAHQSVDCRACHKDEFIKDVELRNKPKSFLGLSKDCLDCHEDYHQNTLPSNCLSCHGMKMFDSSPRFDHNESNYRLSGAHKEVDCQACHPKTQRNGKAFQEFAGIPFNNCTDCHKDVHQGNLGNGCKSCHSTSSFQNINRRFDHSSTGYRLEGKHKGLNCMDCHSNEKTLATLFSDFPDFEQSNCTTCHEDIHEGKFGNDCLQCHSLNSFAYERSDEFFDHSLTTFPLVGKHEFVDCKSCHTESLTEPIAHGECRSCHNNYHEQSFNSKYLEQDCAGCHGEEGFSPSYFSIADHGETAFPLSGAHLATPCIFCHQKEDRWEFKSLSETCVSCHEDIHKSELSISYYPGQDCTICHSTNNWKAHAFDHQQTQFELKGEHSSTNCRSCHVPDKNKNENVTQVIFKVSSQCSQCHEDEHRRQFEEAGGFQDCSLCHGKEIHDWKAEFFNHDSSRFILDGAHINVTCNACHYELEDEKGPYTLYKLNTLECSDCH